MSDLGLGVGLAAGFGILLAVGVVAYYKCWFETGHVGNETNEVRQTLGTSRVIDGNVRHSRARNWVDVEEYNGVNEKEAYKPFREPDPPPQTRRPSRVANRRPSQAQPEQRRPSQSNHRRPSQVSAPSSNQQPLSSSSSSATTSALMPSRDASSRPAGKKKAGLFSAASFFLQGEQARSRAPGRGARQEEDEEEDDEEQVVLPTDMRMPRDAFCAALVQYYSKFSSTMQVTDIEAVVEAYHNDAEGRAALDRQLAKQFGQGLDEYYVAKLNGTDSVPAPKPEPDRVPSVRIVGGLATTPLDKFVEKKELSKSAREILKLNGMNFLEDLAQLDDAFVKALFPNAEEDQKQILRLVSQASSLSQ